MTTVQSADGRLVPAGEPPSSAPEDDAQELAAAMHDAYVLADEIERVLPPSHRGMAHDLRLAAQTAGSLHSAAAARRGGPRPG